MQEVTVNETQNQENLKTATGHHGATIARAKHRRHHAIRKRPQCHPARKNNALKAAGKAPVRVVAAAAVAEKQ